MDLLQNVDIKATNAGAKKADIPVRETLSSGDDTANSKPFKQQLNEQVEKLDSESSLQKSKENQQDNDVLVGDADYTEEKSSASDTQQFNDVNSQPTEVLNEFPAVGVNDAQIDEVLEPVIATGLPETGSELPLLNAPTDQLILQDSGQIKSNQLSAGVVQISAPPASDVDSKIMAQTQADILKNVMINSNGQNTRNPPVEAAMDKVLNKPLNLATSLSEKMNIQDAKLNKVFSELPPGDAILQASRLQQVPVSTAVSSNVLSSNLYSSSLLSTQNISSAGLAEVMNAGNSSASLNSPLLSSAPASTLNLSIAANIQNPNWSQQMTQQVAYMVNGGLQQAEIKLNPAHLGPMKIKLSITDDQATVNFVAQHAPVREALDAALPRLKEMFEQQGLNLADADVSTQSDQQANAESQQDESDRESHQDDSLVRASTDENMNEKIVMNVDVKSGVSIFA